MASESLFEKGWARAVAEWNRASENFATAIAEYPFGELLYTLYFGDPRQGLILVEKGFDIVQDFVQALTLLPVRVLGSLALDRLVWPQVYRQRVMRCDVALGFVLGEILDSGLDVATLNLPVTYNLGKRVATAWDKWRVIRYLDDFALFRLLKSSVTRIAMLIAKIIFMVVATVVSLVLIDYLRNKYLTKAESFRILTLCLGNKNPRKRERTSLYRRVGGVNP